MSRTCLKKQKAKIKPSDFYQHTFMLIIKPNLFLGLRYLREDFHIPSPLFVAPTLSGCGGGGVEDGGYDLNKRESAQPEDDTTQVSAFLAE